MTRPDKEIKAQQAFDGEDFSEQDEALYSMLFQELEKDSGIDIKPEFSDEVLIRLKKKRRRESRFEFLLFAASIVGVLLVVVAGFVFAKNAVKSSPDLLQSSPLAPALLFAGLLILFQFIDKKYLKDYRLKKKLNQA